MWPKWPRTIKSDAPPAWLTHSSRATHDIIEQSLTDYLALSALCRVAFSGRCLAPPSLPRWSRSPAAAITSRRARSVAGEAEAACLNSGAVKESAGTRTHLRDRRPGHLWHGLSAAGVGARRQRAARLRRRAVASTGHDPRCRAAAALAGGLVERVTAAAAHPPIRARNTAPALWSAAFRHQHKRVPRHKIIPCRFLRSRPAQPMSLYPPGVSPPEARRFGFSAQSAAAIRQYRRGAPQRAAGDGVSATSHPPPNYPSQNYPQAPASYSQRAEPHAARR